MFELETRGPVGVLHMQHGKANAMDLEFCEGLTRELVSLEMGAHRAVVLTGRPGMFCAGVDLKRAVDGGPAYLREFLPVLDGLFEAVLSFPKPVVAAIGGHAIAGGCVLAFAADLRLMARDAGRIGIPELRVGVPLPPVAFELVRAAAPRHHRALILTGSTVGAEEAHGLGLVDELIDPDALLDQAVDHAAFLGGLRPEALAVTRRQLRGPVLERAAEAAERLGPEIERVWTDAATVEHMQRFVEATLGRG